MNELLLLPVTVFQSPVKLKYHKLPVNSPYGKLLIGGMATKNFTTKKVQQKSEKYLFLLILVFFLITFILPIGILPIGNITYLTVPKVTVININYRKH